MWPVIQSATSNAQATVGSKSMWDVFHSQRLELLRDLSDAQVRDALQRGELSRDDLVRPAGTSEKWQRLRELEPWSSGASAVPAASATPDMPAAPDAGTPVVPIDPSAPARSRPVPPEIAREIDAIDPMQAATFPALGPDLELGDRPRPPTPAAVEPSTSVEPTSEAPLASPTLSDEVELWPTQPEALSDAESEDDEAADFTLEPPPQPELEEIDLTAMVDVAFQLILFFMVAATTVFLRTLEIPNPNPDKSEAVAVQPRTLEELESQYILVEVDEQGSFQVDHEGVPATASAVSERLRASRTATGRTAMLLSARPEAMHRFAVVAYDAANAIGLRIAIATPPRATAVAD